MGSVYREKTKYRLNPFVGIWQQGLSQISNYNLRQYNTRCRVNRTHKSRKTGSNTKPRLTKWVVIVVHGDRWPIDRTSTDSALQYDSTGQNSYDRSLPHRWIVWEGRLEVTRCALHRLWGEPNFEQNKYKRMKNDVNLNMDVVSPPPLRSHCSVVYLRARDNSNLWECAYQALNEPSRVELYANYGCVEYPTAVVHSADTMTTTTNLLFLKNYKFCVTDTYEWRNYRVAVSGTERAYQKQAIRWTGHVRRSGNRRLFDATYFKWD